MGNHICHVDLNGNAKCWGNGDYGQLGNEATKSIGDGYFEMGSNLPFINLGTGLSAKYIATGFDHSCAHLNNDLLKCWGLNDFGRLGLGLEANNIGGKPGDMGDNLPFVNFGSNITMKEVVAGQSHTCILFDNNGVKCFGYAGAGALGYENLDNIGTDLSQMGDNLPFVNLGDSSFTLSLHSSNNAAHNCVILINQRMKCWGNNVAGQVGTKDIFSRGSQPGSMGNNLPELNLGTESRVKIVGVGIRHTCALRVDDILFCWGWNDSGRLGIGSKEYFPVNMDKLIPVPYDRTGKKIKLLTAGYGQTCILLDDNITLKCVGKNIEGSLGQGDARDRGDSPSTTLDKIPAIDLGTGNLEIMAIKTGHDSLCTVFADNSMKCFGLGDSGQLGLETIYSVGKRRKDMGENLPFVNVFGDASKYCEHTKSKECKRDKICLWVKDQNIFKCVFNICFPFFDRISCLSATENCAWKKRKCLPK